MDSNRPDEIYEFGFFRLSTLSWSLEYKGTLLHLAKFDFLLLLTFLRHPDSFLAKSALAPYLWSDVQKASTRGLGEHIYRLNKILKIGSAGTRLIQYFRGKGYRFLCDVKRMDGSSPKASQTPTVNLTSRADFQ